MPCYYPKTAWRVRSGPDPKTGLWPITFTPGDGDWNQKLQIPCGQCIGCKLEYSKMWAIRCIHESKMYKANCFVTLTYNDEFLEFFKNKLIKKNIQLFLKRLRKKYKNNKIKFFHCGEYGEIGHRAHHHLCLFNHDFDDKYLWNIRDNVRLYRSESLEKLWDYGFSTIGELTLESAAYCARYCLKKAARPGVTKNNDDSYITMSRGGKEAGSHGLGYEFYKKYKMDIYGKDKIVLSNIVCRPVRYYDNLYEKDDKQRLMILKERRVQDIDKSDYTAKRLKVKETVRLLQIKRLQRQLESSII